MWFDTRGVGVEGEGTLTCHGRSAGELPESLVMVPSDDYPRLPAAVRGRVDQQGEAWESDVTVRGVGRRRLWQGPGTLIGRDQELVELRAALQQVAAGGSDALLVDGPAGIGKSRLLLEVVGLARQDGFCALNARASAAERSFAFGVAGQLLEPLLTTSAGRHEEFFAGPALLARRVLDWDAMGGNHSEGPLDTYAALHGLYRLVANLAARQPVLLAIDDVEQADAPSLRWLAYLLRRLERLRLCVVMTQCTGTESTEPELLAEVTTAVRRTSLRGLNLADCARLADEVFADGVSDEFASACCAATGGNPFLLSELVRGLAARDIAPTSAAAAEVRSFGPREVATAVLTRLRKQDPSLALLAGTVAALGEAEPELAAAATGLEVSDVVAGADVLVRIGIFRQGPRLAFAHPIVRSAVQQDPSAVDHEAVHAQTAVFHYWAQAPAEQVAAHILSSPGLDGEWVVEVLAKAADCASARGAPEIAVSYLQRALRRQLPEATYTRLLVQLGMAEMQVDPRAAVGHLLAAHERNEDPLVEANIAIVLAQELGEQERYGEALRILDRAVTAVTLVDPDLAQRVELHILCLSIDECYTESNVSGRLARLGENDRLSPSTARFLTTVVAFTAVLGERSVAEARELVMQAWRTRVRIVPQSANPWDWTNNWEFSLVVLSLIVVERLDLAQEYCSETLNAARERGLSLVAASAAALRAQVNLRKGQVSDAEKDARFALRILDALRAGTRSGTIFALSTLLEILMDRGDFADAMRELTARGLDGILPPVWRYNYLLVTRGMLRANLGDIAGALADLSECGRRFRERGMDNRAVLLWRSLSAMLFDATGRRATALQLAEEEVVLARKWGAPGVLGFALRTAGLVRGGLEGMALLEESVATLEHSELRLELARSLIEWGAGQLGMGQQAHGTAQLRRALDIASASGATALVARVREELGGPAAGAAATSAPLTPHELRIADLVINGLTNREIARKFEVTSRAVELHLTKIYRKLDIKRRSQLAAALNPAATGSVRTSRADPAETPRLLSPRPR